MIALSYVQIQVRDGHGEPIWQRVVESILLPLGWSAPFATTVLGLLAISQIQHEPQRRRGLSLALFDAVLFPLALLNWLIVVSFSHLARSLVYSQSLPPAMTEALFRQFLPIATVILVDYFLISLAWRALNK